jgi:hypothetical protein
LWQSCFALVAAVGLIARRLHADNAPVTGQAAFHIVVRTSADRRPGNGAQCGLARGRSGQPARSGPEWPDFAARWLDPATTAAEMVFVTLEDSVGWPAQREPTSTRPNAR